MTHPLKGRKHPPGCVHCEATRESNRRRAGEKHAPDCSHCQDMRDNPRRLDTAKSRNYKAMHDWVRRRRGSATEYSCELCDQPAKEWANVSGNYLRDQYDYAPMCISCHRNFDVGMRNWLGFAVKAYTP